MAVCGREVKFNLYGTILITRCKKVSRKNNNCIIIYNAIIKFYVQTNFEIGR